MSFRYDANNPIEYTQAIPFIWTSESGRIDLPHAVVGGQYGYTGFNAISADGSTAVGAYGVDGVGRAFRWTSLGGYQFLSSPVGASGAFQASDISADGAIIVGMSGSLNSSTTLAAYWDRSGAGHILECSWTQMGAQRCNADGSVITGMGLPSMGVSQAWVWTQADGVVAAADYFRRNGVDIPAGYTIDGINAVSPDGRSFGGVALSADRRNAFTFIATVPTPSVSAVMALSCFASRRRRSKPNAEGGSNPNSPVSR